MDTTILVGIFFLIVALPILIHEVARIAATGVYKAKFKYLLKLRTLSNGEPE